MAMRGPTAGRRRQRVEQGAFAVQQVAAHNLRRRGIHQVPVVDSRCAAPGRWRRRIRSFRWRACAGSAPPRSAPAGALRYGRLQQHRAFSQPAVVRRRYACAPAVPTGQKAVALAILARSALEEALEERSLVRVSCSATSACSAGVGVGVGHGKKPSMKLGSKPALNQQGRSGESAGTYKAREFQFTPQSNSLLAPPDGIEALVSRLFSVGLSSPAGTGHRALHAGLAPGRATVAPGRCVGVFHLAQQGIHFRQGEIWRLARTAPWQAMVASRLLVGR